MVDKHVERAPIAFNYFFLKKARSFMTPDEVCICSVCVCVSVCVCQCVFRARYSDSPLVRACVLIFETIIQ